MGLTIFNWKGVACIIIINCLASFFAMKEWVDPMLNRILAKKLSNKNIPSMSPLPYRSSTEVLQILPIGLTAGWPLWGVTYHAPYTGHVGVVACLCLWELTEVGGICTGCLINPIELTDLSLQHGHIKWSISPHPSMFLSSFCKAHFHDPCHNAHMFVI